MEKRRHSNHTRNEYAASLTIGQRLAQHDPGNTEWQRELSISHNSLGGIYQAQAKLTEALHEYAANHAIMLLLVQQNPRNPV